MAALLLAPAAAAQPGAMPDPRPLTNDTQLRAALEGIRLEHGVPGMAAAVFDREQVRAFGVGELARGGAPVSPDSRFRAGQVSLLFTALAAASLIEDGSLPEQGEVRRLAPEIDLHNPWSTERPVRVEDLLAHRAGLGATHFRDVFAEPGQAQPLLAGINRAFRALRVEHRPGERERYSVAGFAVAAYLVEKAAGMPYEEVLERMFFRPLEAGASLGRASGALPGDAVGHAGRPAQAVPTRALNFPPAGDIWISARDLARLGQVLLNDGLAGERAIVPAEAIARLHAPPAGGELVPGYRHGVRAEEFNGFIFHTQTGALPGFIARFAYSPALGRGYLVMLNHGDARGALTAADALLRGQLMAGGQLPGAPAPPAADTLDPHQLAGWYADVTPDHPPRRVFLSWLGALRATACGRSLCVSGAGVSATLEPFDTERLRERGRWQPGWLSRAGEDGVTLEGAGRTWQRTDGWRVAAGYAAAAFVGGGAALAVMLALWWTWSLVRRRMTDYHQLVPRLVPLAAMTSVVAFQVLMFTVDYPQLGEVSAGSIAILVASLLAPLLAACAIAAVAAGFFWRLPRRALLGPAYLALAATGAVVAMAMHDLIAFQSWNY